MRLHHVNLAVHPDLIDAEIEFLVTGLGLTWVDPGPELLDRAKWYRFRDGTQVHLSRTADPVVTKPGHLAVAAGDEFDSLTQRLREQGYACRVVDGLGYPIALFDDPAGHQWEIRASNDY